jgi:1-acyl-sn-glycerol-3-phosphate acyltransferase
VTFLYRVVRALIRLALGFYYTEIELRGEEQVPKSGPLLILANHHISLTDPILVISVMERPVRFIAKAPLFDVWGLGFIFRQMGCVPAYRQQDAGYAKEKNDQLFESVGNALVQGDVVGIFPEGISHEDPSIAELKHGASKIALSAESSAEFKLGLRVQVVGIQYEQTRLFRGRLLVTFMPPMTIAEYKDRYAADSREATAALTEQFRENLSAAILEAESKEDLKLAGVLDRVASDDGKKPDLPESFDRKKYILEQYHKLKETHPQEVQVIRDRVQRYHDLMEQAGDGSGGKVGSILFNILLLLLSAPLMALGIVANAFPFWMVRGLSAIRMIREGRGDDVRAGVGIVYSVIIFPVVYAGMAVLGWLYLSPWVWIPILCVSPFCGIMAIRWLERWRRLGRTTWALLVSLFDRSAHRVLDRLADDIRNRVERIQAAEENHGLHQ